VRSRLEQLLPEPLASVQERAEASTRRDRANFAQTAIASTLWLWLLALAIQNSSKLGCPKPVIVPKQAFICLRATAAIMRERCANWASTKETNNNDTGATRLARRAGENVRRDGENTRHTRPAATEQSTKRTDDVVAETARRKGLRPICPRFAANVRTIAQANHGLVS
jgi:hypothetical protein